MQLNQFIKLLLIIFCVYYAKNSYSQDIHFSQINQAPLYLNPANTGNFEGNFRFANNYRNQWTALNHPYKTISASFDKKFKLTKGSTGLGVFFVNDASGSSQLTSNKIYFSSSYFFKHRKHLFSIGLQAGYIIKTTKINSLTFPSQFNPETGYFDPDLPNQLDNTDLNINYTDINVGVNYTTDINDIIPTVGIALFHVNSPNISFLKNSQTKLKPRFALNSKVTIPLNDNFYCQPSLFTSYLSQASDYILGSTIGYNFPEENFLNSAYIGGEIRTQFHSTDAAAFIVGFAFTDINIGLSYDINISRFSKATNYNGAFEISLIYINKFSELNTFTIPCDRY